jgi:hypothetical protein
MMICSGMLLMAASAIAFASPRILHIETEIPDAVPDQAGDDSGEDRLSRRETDQVRETLG